jgi:hypothetical protein
VYYSVRCSGWVYDHPGIAGVGWYGGVAYVKLCKETAGQKWRDVGIAMNGVFCPFLGILEMNGVCEMKGWGVKCGLSVRAAEREVANVRARVI